MNSERAIVAGRIPVLRLSGALDLRNVPEVRRSIRGLIDEGFVRFIIAFTGLEFIDNSGLGVLVDGMVRVREKNGMIKLACSNRRILRVFDMTRLTQLFDIYDSKDADALDLLHTGNGPDEQVA